MNSGESVNSNPIVGCAGKKIDGKPEACYYDLAEDNAINHAAAAVVESQIAKPKEEGFEQPGDQERKPERCHNPRRADHITQRVEGPPGEAIGGQGEQRHD